MSFLAAVLFLSCLPSALIDFAMPKWKSDKNLRIDDAYKWTYQATRGGEHAVPNREAARGWLANEWNSLTPMKESQIWEPLCPGGEIGRLNLRPFKFQNGDRNDLLEAFLASSASFRSDGSSFLKAWRELGRRLKRKPAGRLNYAEWLDLDTRMQAKDYPAVHHSEPYNRAYGPAYRIITNNEMKRLLRIAD